MIRKNSGNDEVIIDGKKLKIGIVAAEFNWDIIGNMLEASLEVLKKNKVKEKNIKIIKVPGAFEIPLACQKLAQKNKFDALIVLGCVIKGETGHYYYVAGESSRGVMDVMLKFSLPIGFGIITTDNLAQAKKRSSGCENKGIAAAKAALKMLSLDF